MTAGAGVTLTVLGCDGSHPGPGGAGSGYLVRHWASATALWLDAGPGFLDADGTIPATLMRDKLHPTSDGYEVWAAALRPVLTELLAPR